MIASLGRGLVRPAVAILSSLRMAWKAFLAGLLLAVPLSLVLAAYVSDKGTQIAVATKEQAGASLLGPLDQVFVQLLATRNALLVGQPVPAGLSSAVSSAESAFSQEGVQLGVAGGWDKARSQIATAESAPANRSSVFADWQTPITTVENLIRSVADNSDLTVDPSIDSNYLQHALAVDLPTYLLAQEEAQDLGSSVTSAGGATFNTEFLQTALPYLLQEVVFDINKTTSQSSDPGLTNQLTPLVQALASAPQDNVGAVDQDASALVTTGTATLERLLAERVSNLHGRQLTYELLGIVLGVIALWFSAGIVVRVAEATSKLIRTMEVVAAGDVTVQVDIEGDDEFGQVAKHLNEVLARIRESLQMISEKTQTVLASSRDLFSVSSEMSGTAEQVSDKATAVSAASEQVNTNVTVVAAAIEEMVASVKEIASNASKASEVATRASGIAAVAGDNIAKLEASSVEISNVVSLITSIAEQTNLLALNATIEAARAGEMGKGFAVVANEVKDLAAKTTKATEDISHRIEAIQANTSSATESVAQIREIVEEINAIQGSIASSVEEQAAAVSEVGRSVSEAAASTSTIVENISGVASSAKANREKAEKNLGSAEELSTVSSELQSLIGNLLGQFHFDNGKVETGTRHFVP
jgi:methyl-accepting chemotaxis protein